MRKSTFLVIGGLVAIAMTASAAPIPASCASQSDFHVITPLTEKDVFNNFAATFSGLTAPPTQTSSLACLQQDKIFSDFTLQSGSLPADLGLTLDLAILGGGVDSHTVNFTSANFGSNFTMSYNVTVSGSTETVVRVTGGILNSPSLSPASLTKTVCAATGCGDFMGSTTTSNSTSADINVPNLTALAVTDAFTAGGGGVTNIANTFIQSEVPEPATTALFGAGLLIVGLVSRRYAKS